MDLHQPVDLRLERRGLGELSDLLLVGLDRDRQLFEVLHHRPGDVVQLLRPRSRVEVVKVGGGTLRNAEPHRLGDAAHLHDDARALLDQDVAHLMEVDHLLVLRSAQLHRMEKPDVCERHPCKRPCVVHVVLRLRFGDHLQTAGIRDVHLEAHARCDLAHPAAVRTRLEGHGR